MDVKTLFDSKCSEFDNLCELQNIDYYYKRPIVIFPAGDAGRVLFDYFKQIKNITPVAFGDNDNKKQGAFYQGVPIYSLENLAKEYDLAKCTIIIASHSYFFSIEDQLRAAGVPDECIIDFFALPVIDKDFSPASCDVLKNLKGVWEVMYHFSPEYKKRADAWERRSFMLDNADKIEKVYELLADEKSKDIYRKYIFALGKPDIEPPCKYGIFRSMIEKNQYFVEGIIKVGDKETFIDGGAFDGSETLEVARLGGKERLCSVLFEPDERNAEKIRARLTASGLTDFHVLAEALYDKNTMLSFQMGSEMESVISEAGNVEIKAVALDSCLSELGIDDVSFIKLDIEGAEKEALAGAKNAIQKNRPKLVICIYHKWEDVFAIPLLIKELVPDYKLYIRAHGFICELVCYAVC